MQTTPIKEAVQIIDDLQGKIKPSILEEFKVYSDIYELVEMDSITLEEIKKRLNGIINDLGSVKSDADHWQENLIEYISEVITDMVYVILDVFYS